MSKNINEQRIHVWNIRLEYKDEEHCYEAFKDEIVSALKALYPDMHVDAMLEPEAELASEFFYDTELPECVESFGTERSGQ